MSNAEETPETAEVRRIVREELSALFVEVNTKREWGSDYIEITVAIKHPAMGTVAEGYDIIQASE